MYTITHKDWVPEGDPSLAKVIESEDGRILLEFLDSGKRVGIREPFLLSYEIGEIVGFKTDQEMP